MTSSYPFVSGDVVLGANGNGTGDVAFGASEDGNAVQAYITVFWLTKSRDMTFDV